MKKLIPISILVFASFLSCSKDKEEFYFDGLAYEADIVLMAEDFKADSQREGYYSAYHYITYNADILDKANMHYAFIRTIEITPADENYYLDNITTSIGATSDNKFYVKFTTKNPISYGEFILNVKIYVRPKE